MTCGTCNVCTPSGTAPETPLKMLVLIPIKKSQQGTKSKPSLKTYYSRR